MRRLTVIADEELLEPLEAELSQRGISGMATALGRPIPDVDPHLPISLCRIEIIVPPEICDQLVDELGRNLTSDKRLSFCVETVYVSGGLLSGLPTDSSARTAVAAHA